VTARDGGALAPEAITAFRREGFVLAPGFLDAHEVARLATAADDLERAPETRGGAWRYRDQSSPVPFVLHRIERFRAHHAGLRAILDAPHVHRALGALFGEPAVLFKEKINYKPPGGSRFAAHQDVQAGWGRYASRFVSMMVSIDATTRENGCLEIARGPRVAELLGPLWEPLDDAAVARLDFAPFETAPGDALFFDGYVAHRSAPNTTTCARRVLYATYNPASEGDHYDRYYADKFASYPPDIERAADKTYRYRV
jgi:hypothetical protein